MEELMSVDEVAKILKVHSMTVLGMIYRGKLEAHKVGANIRINKEDLNKYLSRTKIQSKRPGSGDSEEKFSSAKSLLKFAGNWSGSKEEYYDVLKAFRDSQSDAEF